MSKQLAFFLEELCTMLQRTDDSLDAPYFLLLFEDCGLFKCFWLLDINTWGKKKLQTRKGHGFCIMKINCNDVHNSAAVVCAYMKVKELIL